MNFILKNMNGIKLSFLLVVMVFMIACSGNETSEKEKTSFTKVTVVSGDNEISENITFNKDTKVSGNNETSENATFTQAAIESEGFVKEKLAYPEEVEFGGDKRGSETSPNEFDVLQKFTAKNAFGVKISYVYKIHMIFHGGDWTDNDNWSYSTLIIEDVSSGKQEKFYGDVHSKKNE